LKKVKKKEKGSRQGESRTKKQGHYRRQA